MKRTIRFLSLAALLLFASGAHAWWNGDWAHRVKVTLSPGPAGADLKQGLAQVPVLVRLHTGNFNFANAKTDGADLRFMTADDKLPLKHHVEKWDAKEELALVWVQVPALSPTAAEAYVWLYHGNPKAPTVDDVKGTYDPNHVAVLHFAEQDGAARDATGYANNAAQAPEARNPASIIGGGAQFAGGEGLAIVAAPSLKFGPAAGLSFSAWIKAAGTQNATLFALNEGGRQFTFSVAGGNLVAGMEGPKAPKATGGTPLSPDTWQHVAVTAGKRIAIFLDGNEIGAVDAEIPEFGAAAIVLAQKFTGEVDEVAVSNIARPADWFKAAAKGQGQEAQLAVLGEPEQSSGGGVSYAGILLAAVTIDGWIVIGILAVMLVVSFWVMGLKMVVIGRSERANGAFVDAFRKASANRDTLLELPASGYGNSTVYRMYAVGTEEVKTRVNGTGAALTAKGLDSIRASLDAVYVRESQKLNSLMVLLTICISGGPFLGLLGTVVGVMVTFAAIAATGDVNVAAIAPGIAGALVATVAGLGVAIPALFGYNYIGSKIKAILADMQVFSGEYLSRVAENYGA